ncbi:hypothetical protein EVAR_44769_1 [Eumeta japonica]|uniref:Uncharacterized protein n=1 Tax=Eumeta variegata TaxID=151549 RepID=A0A4C1Y7U2_EUMVA|nr:hypothetical protein EVAR_44769_1 [Eumeta japonica]
MSAGKTDREKVVTGLQTKNYGTLPAPTGKSHTIYMKNAEQPRSQLLMNNTGPGPVYLDRSRRLKGKTAGSLQKSEGRPRTRPESSALTSLETSIWTGCAVCDRSRALLFTQRTQLVIYALALSMRFVPSTLIRAVLDLGQMRALRINPGRYITFVLFLRRSHALSNGKFEECSFAKDTAEGARAGRAADPYHGGTVTYLCPT